jgi:chitinase
VSISSPVAGATVSGSVPVSATASDNVGVTRVEFSVDGGVAATSTAAPYGFTWDASTAAPGAHTIAATAFDASGNRTSSSVSVTVATPADTTAPSVSIASPTAGATVSGSVAVQASASDNLSVTKVILSLDGSVVSTLTASPWTFSVDTTALADGIHTLTATAFDAAGNSSSAEVSVTVQNAAATADTTAPSRPSSLRTAVAGTTQLAIFWSPSTDNVGIVGYDVYRDGSLVAQTVLPNYLDSSLTPGTNHVYSVRSRDAAGNTSVASSNLGAKTVALSTSSTGTLAGVIYNTAGRPVANAVVQLTGNGITKSAKTNSSGVYKFTSLPPGGYTLTITLPVTAGAGAIAAATSTATVVPGQTVVSTL